MHQPNTHEARSVLANLRALIPQRPTDFEEAKKIAEIQANRLLCLFDITAGGVPSEIVGDLPRVRVIHEDLPARVSGASHWSGTHWIISLNKNEPPVRQRFTLMHEFKHIIDHGRTHLLYVSNSRYTAAEQAERAADHFAGAVLVPTSLLKRAWTSGLQTSSALARHFHVSIQAVEIRLSQTRLNADRDTCFKSPIVEQFARGRHSLYRRQLAAQGVSS